MISQYRDKGESFGFETTLAGKWVAMIEEMRALGYAVHIFFLDLGSIELAVSRVKYRVEFGGHSIPEETIRRRYTRARRNFWYNYKNLADSWYLFDNSSRTPELVANCIENETKVVDDRYFDFFVSSLEALDGSKR